MIGVKEIAKQAQVSLSTASQILRNPDDKRYAVDTRRKVLKISSDVKYVPNSSARALALRKTHCIGLMAMDWRDPQWHVPLAVAGEIAAQHGYTVVIAASTAYDEWLDMLLSGKVDFLISLQGVCCGSEKDYGLIQRVRNRFAVIGPTSGKEIRPHWAVTVNWDEAIGGKIMAEFFMAHGHKELAMLSGDCISDRTIGFVRHVQQAGLCPWVVLTPVSGIPDNLDSLMSSFPEERLLRTSKSHNDDRRSLGEFQMAELLTAHPDITGAYCRNETYAIGAIRKAVQLGLAVPQNVSVAGHCDIGGLFPAITDLTTIRNPVEDAMKLILEKYFAGEFEASGEPKQIVLNCTLVNGGTVARPDPIVAKKKG